MDRIFLYSILAILLILSIGTTIYYIIKFKKEKITIDSLLLYLQDMTLIAKQAIEVSNIKREDFQSDKDYCKTVSSLIMDDIRSFLIKKTPLDNDSINNLDEEALFEICYKIVSFIIDKEPDKKISNMIDEIIEVNEDDDDETKINENSLPKEFYNEDDGIG